MQRALLLANVANGKSNKETAISISHNHPQRKQQASIYLMEHLFPDTH